MTLQKETRASFYFRDYFKDALREGRPGLDSVPRAENGTSGPSRTHTHHHFLSVNPKQTCNQFYREVQKVVTYSGVGLDLLEQSSTPDRTESNKHTVQPFAIQVPPMESSRFRPFDVAAQKKEQRGRKPRCKMLD